MNTPPYSLVDDAERFAQDLPFWINGTLTPSAADWMEAFLHHHPALQAEVDHARNEWTFSQNIRSPLPQTIRLQRLMDTLRWPSTEQPKNRAAPRSDTQAPAGPSPSGEWLRIGGRPWLHVLGGSLLGIGLALTGASVWQGQQELTSQPMHRGERLLCSQSAGVRVVFKPEMPWSELTQLARHLQLQIVQGPSEDGEVWLQAPQEAPTAQTLALLRNNPWVEQALAAPTRPSGNCPR